MGEKSMNDLVDLIRGIELPEEHREDFFWAPRNITCQEEHAYPGIHPGYTLYAYGGSVMSLYCVDDNEKEYYGDPFAKSYIKYFSDTKKGNDIRKEFLKKRKEGLEFLKTWEHWDTVFEAFERRPVEIKMGKERKRENRIANKNSSCGKKIEVFDMESNTKMGELVAKADMMWLRFEDDKPIVSFVEYKCTKSAMERGKDGKDYSLPGHFRKMSKYFSKGEVKERVWELLKRKRLLNGEPEVSFPCAGYETEIVFLFSHVNPTRRPKHDKGVSEGNIKKRIREMYKENEDDVEAYKEQLRFGFIEDENSDLSNMELISAVDMDFTSEKTIGESLKLNLR